MFSDNCELFCPVVVNSSTFVQISSFRQGVKSSKYKYRLVWPRVAALVFLVNFELLYGIFVMLKRVILKILIVVSLCHGSTVGGHAVVSG